MLMQGKLIHYPSIRDFHVSGNLVVCVYILTCTIIHFGEKLNVLKWERRSWSDSVLRIRIGRYYCVLTIFTEVLKQQIAVKHLDSTLAARNTDKL